MTLKPGPAAPGQVLLFSGHRVDAPGRPNPRLPANQVPVAAARIAAALDALQAGPRDLALSQAAAGGDLLFLEACQQRGVPARVCLPLPVPAFVEQSVRPSGADWCHRFDAVCARLAEPPRVLAPAANEDPFARCNAWLLQEALAWGPQRLRFICLWNGTTGDGPGGTAHMVEAVCHHTRHIHWIDTRTL